MGTAAVLVLRAARGQVSWGRLCHTVGELPERAHAGRQTQYLNEHQRRRFETLVRDLDGTHAADYIVVTSLKDSTMLAIANLFEEMGNEEAEPEPELHSALSTTADAKPESNAAIPEPEPAPEPKPEQEPEDDTEAAVAMRCQ